MEILENLENEIKALSAKIEQVSKKVEQPPVVKIDTARLATAVAHNLSDYAAAGEKVARRIEAAAASIPREIKKQYGIDPPTRTLAIAMLLLVLATGLAVFFSVPRLDAQRLDSQAEAIEWYKHELEYMRSKNPKTAANYDAEFRQQ
jgi:hypothetical protein